MLLFFDTISILPYITHHQLTYRIMRQRKFTGNDELSCKPDRSDESDPEAMIQASSTFHNNTTTSVMIRKGFEKLAEGKIWWSQTLTIYFSALLTYSFYNAGMNNTNNVQIAIMTVITFFGASPFCSTHLIPASIGAFVGGHDIIGSIGPLQMHDLDETDSFPSSNYLWLLLLSVVVGIIWSFVITAPSLRILDGYAGRLGTTTFLGMNVAMLTAYGPLGITDWDRYYYGLIHVIHVAEEDSSLQLSKAWSWTEDVEVAVGYVLAVIWLGVLGGAIRICHNKYIVQSWNTNSHEKQNSPQECHITNNQSPPAPLNNVLVPCLLALLSMLLVNTTQYQHAPGLFNGFAVGAYVAMASLQKIPSITKFLTVSLVAALWGLALSPFFVGFAGKSGFTSMLGHVTHVAFEKYLAGRLRSLVMIQEQNACRQEEEGDGAQWQIKIPTVEDEMEPLSSQHDSEGNRKEEDEKDNYNDSSNTYTFHRYRKYIKPKESLQTKKQRRQQQRLQHRQSYPGNWDQRNDDTQQDSPVIMHRGWSAVPAATADEGWHHRLRTKSQDEGDGEDCAINDAGVPLV